MCMLDDCDDQVPTLSQSDPVARKDHKCAECGREIAPGERYHVDRFTWEGAMRNHKTCAHCMVAREWLIGECGGCFYGGVGEDLREHVNNGGYPLPVYRMAVGMSWQWRTPRGTLLGVPKKPSTWVSETTLNSNNLEPK